MGLLMYLLGKWGADALRERARDRDKFMVYEHI